MTTSKAWFLVASVLLCAACQESTPATAARVSGQADATDVHVAAEVGGREVHAALEDREHLEHPLDRLGAAAPIAVEPARESQVLRDGERGEHAGGVGGEVGEVLVVGFFDPVAIGLRRARFADGDRHSLSRKGNGRGKSRVLRAIRPAVRANYSNRLLRRRRAFRSGSSSVGSGIGRAGSGVGSAGSRVSGSSARIGGGFGRRVSRGGSRVSSGRSSFGSSGSRVSSGVGGLFLLGAAGTQHEGNRNGAPDLCIHRQLPQYVSEKLKALPRSEQLNC